MKRVAFGEFKGRASCEALFSFWEVVVDGKRACWVYILWSESAQRYYLGQMYNVARRLHMHNEGREKWTKRGVPWQWAGVAPVKLPSQGPNLNATAERFVRSVKSECLSKLLLFSEDALRRAVPEYVQHYKPGCVIHPTPFMGVTPLTSLTCLATIA